jgi:acyl-coenzyme A synthetase/AMP-(fatty) acid ligase
VLKNGRLHTGDVATMDAQGYVFIVDRIKDMIITNGYKVYPRHVEEAIYLNPAVEECIVAGLPDAARGEIVKAFVVLRAGRPADAGAAKRLQEHCKSLTAPYKYPREIAFVDSLPKTLTGKIRRSELRERERAANA